MKSQDLQNNFIAFLFINSNLKETISWRCLSLAACVQLKVSVIRNLITTGTEPGSSCCMSNGCAASITHQPQRLGWLLSGSSSQHVDLSTVPRAIHYAFSSFKHKTRSFCVGRTGGVQNKKQSSVTWSYKQLSTWRWG